MQDTKGSQIAEQAKDHLEAFLGIVVVPIPALLVLGQALFAGGLSEGGNQIDVFGLKMTIRVASLLVGGSVILLLLAAARSLGALAFLLENDAEAEAAKEAIQSMPHL
jgi:hypothetical protein